MTAKLETTGDVERMYSIEKAALLLSVSHWGVRKWIRERRIASVKIGARVLIPSSEIARLIATGTRPAALAPEK